MEFINKNGPVKIRIGEPENCYWAKIRKNERIELSPDHGKALGLTQIRTTEGQIGNKKVETKQIDNEFLKELIKIKGIGKKTAQDITKIFPVREELIKTIRLNADTNALPLRDDISKILYKRYKNE